MNKKEFVLKYGIENWLKVVKTGELEKLDAFLQGEQVEYPEEEVLKIYNKILEAEDATRKKD